MMNNPKPISEFLVPDKRAHLVGIGGVSMCPLAEVLAGKGLLCLLYTSTQWRPAVWPEKWIGTLP